MRLRFCLIIALVSSLSINCLIQTSTPCSPNAAPNNSVADTYPHISALENAILGKSYTEQSLSVRLGRMEQQAFGTSSTNPDLSARTDALDVYTEKQLHKSLLQANNDDDNAQNANAYSTAPSDFSNEARLVPEQADYPHITSLEQTILGQSFAGQALPDRLSRMEIKAFGNASTNPDLSVRTDLLEAYAEKTLHKPPTINSESNDDGAQTTRGKSQSGGLLSKVGQTLISMAAGPALGGIGGPGMGFGGMGNGLGGGGMGRGFGGGQMNRGNYNRQANPQPESQPVKREDDPAIFLADPPDASAKLLTKVGWCEMHVFGHTFPDMHLTARLGQLNKELLLEPGKSNIQLMDDIGIMIKAVQTRKQ